MDGDDERAQPVDTLQAHDHQTCIAKVLDEVTAAAAEEGVRFTSVRRRALEILLESHTAIGAYDLLRRLDEEGFGAQPPVAYRALEFLVSHGFAHRIERLNAFVACMHPREGHDPAFMICRSCKSVAETLTGAIPTTIGDNARDIGFKIERTTVEIEGLCPKCTAGEAA